MAVSSACIYEVQTTGSDTTSSGGFVAGASGTDYSYASQQTFGASDLVVDASVNTKVTAASHNFVAADVGNIIQITGGAGWTVGFYEIVSCASNAATLDRSPAATSTTGGVWAEGGALASLGKAGFATATANGGAAGQDIYQKSGSYTVTSATVNIAAGCLTLIAGASASNTSRLIGYQTTRDDYGTKPVNTASGISTFSMIIAGGNNYIANLELDGAALTGSRGFSVSTGGNCVYACKASNCKNSNYVGSSADDIFVNCYGTGASTAGACFYANACFGCEARANTVHGFLSSSNANFAFCISSGNTGSTTDGFNLPNLGTYSNLTADGNGRHGFNITAGTSAFVLINCLATNHSAASAYGYTADAAMNHAYLIKCAGYNNNAGNVNTARITSFQIGFVTVTTDPYNNQAGNDFSPNNTATGGGLLRGAALPGAFPGGATTGYLDIGAVQHHDNYGPIIGTGRLVRS